MVDSITVRDDVIGAELSNVGYSMNRDLLGTIYRFTLLTTNGVIGVEAIVGDDTALIASKNADKEGVNYSALSLVEKQQYYLRYGATHGFLFAVGTFKVDRIVDKTTFLGLRRAFLKLFFKSQSRFDVENMSVESSMSNLVDQVQFYPYDVDRRLCGMFNRGDT